MLCINLQISALDARDRYFPASRGLFNDYAALLLLLRLTVRLLYPRLGVMDGLNGEGIDVAHMPLLLLPAAHDFANSRHGCVPVVYIPARVSFGFRLVVAA